MASVNNIVLANASRIVSLCQSVRGFLLGTELYLGEVLVPRSPNNGDSGLSPTLFEGASEFIPIPVSPRRPPRNDSPIPIGSWKSFCESQNKQAATKETDTTSSRLDLLVQGTSEGPNELAVKFQANCSMENPNP